ncbi:hypothetical protein G7054_g11194 [Neopestalotiopsis clavispora]|nr:hypothetical protein G7054_g11194 [Neopestalotiopsis clavispora]
MNSGQPYYETPGHVIAGAIALSVMDVAMLLMRFWTRRKKKQGLKADDWLMVPATIMTIGIGVAMIYGASRKALAHRTIIPSDFAGDPFELATDQLVTMAKIEFAFILLLPCTLTCIKASFLLFYARIFIVDKRGRISYLLNGMLAFVIIWGIAFFFVDLFSCKLHVQAFWGSTQELETECKNSMLLVLSLCITDFAADAAIIAIPVPLIWHLNLSLQNKIHISAIFLLGSVSVGASLARLIIEARAVDVGFAPGSDSVLVVTEYIYWGFIECAVGICAACLPTLQGLVTKDALRRRQGSRFSPLRTIFKARSKDSDNRFIEGGNVVPRPMAPSARLRDWRMGGPDTDYTELSSARSEIITDISAHEPATIPLAEIKVEHSR